MHSAAGRLAGKGALLVCQCVLVIMLEPPRRRRRRKTRTTLHVHGLCMMAGSSLIVREKE